MSLKVHPEAILKELHRTWREISKYPAKEGKPVLRACSKTVYVLAAEGDDPVQLAQIVGELSQIHPARFILLFPVHDAGRIAEARVSIQCWLPLGQNEQICSEHIEIRFHPDATRSLVPVLDALPAPDLPIVSWVRSPRLATDPWLISFFTQCDKLILDGAHIDDTELIPRLASEWIDRGLTVGDTGWAAITPLREVIADAVLSLQARSHEGDAITQVLIEAPSETSLPVRYLKAWLAAALPEERPELTSREIPVNIQRSSDDLPLSHYLHRLVIQKASGDFLTLKIADNLVEIRTPLERSCRFLRVRSQAQVLAEELSVLGRDTVYEAAVKGVVGSGG